MASYNGYMREYLRERYQKRRADAIEALGGICQECKVNVDLNVCAIDSTVRTVKSVFSLSNEKFIPELRTNFRLLCKTCRYNTESSRNFKHGAYVAYYRKDCRCDECLEWHSNSLLERAELRKLRKQHDSKI
jgi:hypothetical protein